MQDEAPLGLEAAKLLDIAREAGTEGVVFVADSEERARGIARFINSVAPETPALVLPSWDCLPYDTASPSSEAMGRRMSVLGRLSSANRPAVLITTFQAALQRLPPASAVMSLEIRAGGDVDVDALRDFCRRAGYTIDERVDEVGEVAFRGEMVDVFPGACPLPYRLELDGGRLRTIRRYDPVTQRSVEEAERLALWPVSELPGEDDDRAPGAEHRLPEAYPGLATLFDFLPEAALVEPAGAATARRAVLAEIEDAYRDRLRQDGETSAALPPDRLYLTEDEWERAAAARRRLVLQTGEDGAIPLFAGEARPGHALKVFLDAQQRRGRTVVLTAPSTRALEDVLRRAQAAGAPAPDRVERWDAVAAAPERSLLALEAALEHGFIDGDGGLAVVTAGDLLGSRVEGVDPAEAADLSWQVDLAEFQLGDVVAHIDHGLGRLAGLEAAPGPAAGEAIRLTYAEDDTLLAPASDAGKLWRYGSADSEVALDRLSGETWRKRRGKIARALAETARDLVAAAAERSAREAPVLAAPKAAYERFVAGFPFAATPDQRRAIEAALRDLGSGAPMNRLVIGDVGFGKTEVALRAAATAALAGVQVAVVAPTTVLARQHFETFRRRFAGFGVEIGHLSRLVGAGEARRVRAGLADGAIRLVVGTHSLLGDKVAFADLGLLIVDEEQRFGARHKQRLRTLGATVHQLTMTATPIPRTLQTALIGLQDLSTIDTPPLRRRPIRTLLAELDAAVLRQVLMREKRRGGQSFVVAPRVEDIAPTADMLARIAPRLTVRIAHGQMPAREVDEEMVAFADGQGDILLATSIIESGLDVPRANTMIVLRPDLFGLAQLHQLRGRVGRSRAQAFCYLMSEPGQALGEAAARRLGTLQALDRLGAGMAISLHDLEARGGGEVFGERQAGHAGLIGPGLYQEMLADAVRAAKGEPDEAEGVVAMAGSNGAIPDDYVPDAAMRINVYHRLARTRRRREVEVLADEIADRFGPPPDPVRLLLDGARARAIARELDVVRISAGPDGVALSFAPRAAAGTAFADMLERMGDQLDWNGERLLYRKSSDTPEAQLATSLDLLELLA